MLNNKGFSLVEILVVLVIISIATFVILKEVGSTLSVSSKDAYKLMKNNIVSASEDYIRECEAGLINSDFSFSNNNTFKAKVLENYGFFSNMKSPIDGRYVGDCLIIIANKVNGAIVVDIEDNCY